MAKSLLLRLRLATVESEKEEMLHEVRQLRKMGQAGDLPRDLVSSLLLSSKKLIHFTESTVEKRSADLALPDQLKEKVSSFESDVVNQHSSFSSLFFLKSCSILLSYQVFRWVLSEKG